MTGSATLNSLSIVIARPLRQFAPTKQPARSRQPARPEPPAGSRKLNFAVSGSSYGILPPHRAALQRWEYNLR